MDEQKKFRIDVILVNKTRYDPLFIEISYEKKYRLWDIKRKIQNFEQKLGPYMDNLADLKAYGLEEQYGVVLCDLSKGKKI